MDANEVLRQYAGGERNFRQADWIGKSMIRKILFLASLPMIVAPFISMGASPVAAAQQLSGSLLSSSNNEPVLVADYYRPRYDNPQYNNADYHRSWYNNNYRSNHDGYTYEWYRNHYHGNRDHYHSWYYNHYNNNYITR